MIFLAILIVPTAIQISQVDTAAALDVPVYLKVMAEPDPIGVGQTVYISLFFTKPIPVIGAFGGGSLYEDLTVVITDPDGQNQTLGPFTADTTGGVGGIEFTPSKIGEHSVQAFYPGQDLTGGDYHIMATQSESDKFTVQEESIPGFYVNPLPTEYWSRPIYSTNFAWAQLGGNWWGLGKPAFTDTGGYDASGNNFNPYSHAPNTGHIMWVKQVALGGQVGEPISGDQESQYTSTSILYKAIEPVILNGVIYYKVYSNTPTTETSAETPGWNAVDLRTGELLWHKDTKDTLDFAMVLQFHTVQEYGSQAWLVGSSSSPAMFSTGTGAWQLFDPVTGYFVANITNVPAPAGAGLVETDDDSSQGAVYQYTINAGNLRMWNSTRCLSMGAPSFFGPSTPSAVTFRPSGNINYTAGYQWEVPIPTTCGSETINPGMSIAAQSNEVIVLRSYPEALDTFAAEFGEDYAFEAGYDAKTGDKLWGPVKRSLPRFHEIATIAIGDESTGQRLVTGEIPTDNTVYYVNHDKDTNQAYVYNALTGKQIGSVIQLEGSALSTLARAGAIAYGKCYIWDYGGYVNAIDLETATVSWTVEPRNAGYETPYGIYPIWHFGSHSIADGKLFLSEGRMYDPPLFPNARKLAINCTDGSLVWSVLGTYARVPSAIADGYMLAYNSYDAQMYVFGKGPTSTTANVAINVVPSGTSVLITGNVMDEATGTKDSDRLARFPNGVAAVSDESQSAWMEYVYMQQPKPLNATGVSVELFVIDANNNYRSIGTTTTDTTGFYSYNWMPDIPGKYTVYAQFAGSESYWPSQATTAFAVDEAPEPTPAPTESPPSMVEQYFLPAVIAIIVVIIIIGALIMLMVRKK